LGGIPRVEWRDHDLETAKKGRKRSLLGRSRERRVFARENVRADVEGLGELVVKGERCTEGSD